MHFKYISKTNISNLTDSVKPFFSFDFLPLASVNRATVFIISGLYLYPFKGSYIL